jgi:hypothetical protein
MLGVCKVFPMLRPGEPWQPVDSCGFEKVKRRNLVANHAASMLDLVGNLPLGRDHEMCNVAMNHDQIIHMRKGKRDGTVHFPSQQNRM